PRRYRIRALLSLGGLLLAVVIGETGLRLAGVSHPIFHRADEHLGWALIPGAEGWWTQEGRTYLRLSSDGLRDREHSREKPDGTLRVAVLGDSFTAAFQVPVERTFWSVMEGDLNRCPALHGRRAEAVNFGVNGYSTSQELLTLRHRVRAFSPDVVVVAVYTGNDIFNNSKAMNPDDAAPRFIEKDGALVLDRSFQNTPRHIFHRSVAGAVYRRIVGASRLLQVVRAGWKSSQRARQARSANDAAGGTSVSASIYREPVDPLWREAWAITERLLATMRDEVHAMGARFLVVTLSNPEQVYPGPSARAARARALGVLDLAYPDRRIASLGRRTGFPVLNLAPVLQAHADRTGEFLHGFANKGSGHWNELGHQRAGRVVSETLCRQVLTESPGRPEGRTHDASGM
ncbi:MAG: SGNH/GDSL hydrolase family protein, partial [Acidobacteriota bacterium]|nr:SGNH/GDSL hydrolase family protein [Acidobacteriota bacterium]